MGTLLEDLGGVSDAPGGGLILNLRDVRSRAEAEEARRQSEQRLQGLIGTHPNLARVKVCSFDHPPFYVAYEHIPGRPMAQWLEQAGADATPEVRLELVAQLADALEVLDGFEILQEVGLSAHDELLRQVDGGASVMVGDIREARFSYWDENGQVSTQPAFVRLVVIEVMMSGRGIRAVREISLRA